MLRHVHMHMPLAPHAHCGTTNQLILVIPAYKYIYWLQNKILSHPVDVKRTPRGEKMVSLHHNHHELEW